MSSTLKAFAVVDVDHKGQGMIATRNIKAGECILSETPIIVEMTKEGLNRAISSINSTDLFVASVSFMGWYRLWTSLSIAILASSKLDLIVQLFDGVIFKSIANQFALITANPSIFVNNSKIVIPESQLTIQRMETVLQSLPMLVIKLYFMFKTEFLFANGLFVISSLFSLISMLIVVIINDSRFIKSNETANFHLQLTNGCNCNDYCCSRIIVNMEESTDINIVHEREYGKQMSVHCCKCAKWRRLECISFLWLFRVIFRTLEVISRFLIVLLAWIVISEYLFIILYSLEFAATIIWVMRDESR